jgi:hypothetical protein
MANLINLVYKSMDALDIIHPVLTQSLQRLRDLFAVDDRCVTLCLAGSLDTGAADEWSDVDLVAAIRDEDYAQVKDEMRSICDAQCGPILLWLLEGESRESVNFAFLFEVGDRVHLYDFSIFTVTAFKAAKWFRPRSVLFDKAHLTTPAEGASDAATFDPRQLQQHITNWWVYTYLNGKYYKRLDIYKMLYVQQVIFGTHVRVLNAMYPDSVWNWWARDVHHLPAEQQAQLLMYFPPPEPRAIADTLVREMDAFSRDAQQACARWNMAYPHQMEAGVRRHLRFMGVTP